MEEYITDDPNDPRTREVGSTNAPPPDTDRAKPSPPRPLVRQKVVKLFQLPPKTEIDGGRKRRRKTNKKSKARKSRTHRRKTNKKARKSRTRRRR